MWIVEQRDPSRRWFIRATAHERQDAEDRAHLLKAHSPKLRFRYCHVDEELVDDSEPIEV
jgi:hypothetical protein